MYKNNFDEAFDNACKAPGFAGFVLSQRINLFVKWAVFAALFGFATLMIYRSNDSEFAGILDIVLLVPIALFFAFAYSVFFPKFGKYKKSEEAFRSLLIDVLDDCFDEEIFASEVGLDRAEYEKSSLYERFADLGIVRFTSADFAVNVKTSKAKINIYDVTVHVRKISSDPKFFQRKSTTKIIFAVVRFPSGLSPNSVIEKGSEKVYMSSNGDTLYIEIDRSLSPSGMTRKNIRKSCLNICEYISLILDIVEQV